MREVFRDCNCIVNDVRDRYNADYCLCFKEILATDEIEYRNLIKDYAMVVKIAREDNILNYKEQTLQNKYLRVLLLIILIVKVLDVLAKSKYQIIKINSV